MANIAVPCGSNTVSQGRDIVHKELHHFVSVNKLKIFCFLFCLFFAVDKACVARLLIFPYTHQNWKCSTVMMCLSLCPQKSSVLLICILIMAFVTYVLLAGMTGHSEKISPKVLGLCKHSTGVGVKGAVALLLDLYVVTVGSELSIFQVLAYSGSQYVGLILSVLLGLLFRSSGYCVALAWASVLIYIIVCALWAATSDPDSGASPSAPSLVLPDPGNTAFHPLIIH